VPFAPLPLLILFDDTGSRCGKVVPQMKMLLEHRGFDVTTHRVQDGPIDISPFRGIVLGAPTFGVGLKDLPPTDALADYLDALEDIDEKQIAVFTVYRLWPGNSLERLKGLVLRLGAQFVAWHGYPMGKLDKGEHVIPAECMVRIR
jgi:hypothetical protein